MFGFNEIMKLFGGHVCLGPGRLTARVTVPPLRRTFSIFLMSINFVGRPVMFQMHDLKPGCGQSIALEFQVTFKLNQPVVVIGINHTSEYQKPKNHLLSSMRSESARTDVAFSIDILISL